MFWKGTKVDKYYSRRMQNQGLRYNRAEDVAAETLAELTQQAD